MPHKEERKVIRAGPSSLAVTLPKGWTRFFSLEPGDTIQLVSNDEISIRPIKDKEEG